MSAVTDHERFGEIVSRGFDAGNYCNAYETASYGKGLEIAEREKVPRVLRRAYLDAFTLGFFGSYELHEMGAHRDAFEAAYRSEGGQQCIRAGYCDAREPSELESEE